jgi:dolichol-phosphate mannosyltransferase
MTRRLDKSKTSIVVPIHNEEEVLVELHSRITGVSDEVGLLELIFIDDGSTDNSWKLVEELQRIDSRVVGIKLTRNFGHQSAVLCGLSEAKGEVVVIMDGDLQDPPELIPTMIGMLGEDVDIVFGKRTERDGESWLKRSTAKLFYRIFDSLVPFEIPLDVGDFRVFKRRVGEVVLVSRDTYPFVRALFAHSGFKAVPFSYKREARFAGTTKYTYSKMFKLALTALLTFSEAPFRLALRMGFLSLMGAAIASTYAIFHAITESAWPGWASLFLPIIFFGSLNFFFVALLGNYITSLVGVVSNRPRWIKDVVIRTR